MAMRCHHNLWFMATALLCGLGCTARSALLFETPASANPGDGPTDTDGTDSMMSWGRWLQTRTLPTCETGALLTVTTAAEELDGGTGLNDPAAAGPELSLWEALQIATNRPGYDVIQFDPARFPIDAPTTITISDALPLPQPISAFCLSGVGAGVRLRWQDGIGSGCWQCTLQVGDGALLVGLETERQPERWLLGSGQIAGCYLDATYVAVEANQGATVGPDNVFVGTGTGIRNTFYDGMMVQQNFFGFDPRAARSVPLTWGLALFSSATVDGNQFGGQLQQVITYVTQDNATLFVRHNHFGVTPNGDSLDANGPLLRAGGNPSNWQIGPGNVFAKAHGVGLQMILGTADFVEVTQNSIYDNSDGGLQILGTATPTPAPEITAITAESVTGTCSGTGRIEVFEDGGAQGQNFVGTANCVDGTWLSNAVIPAGRFATATLTDERPITSTFSVPVPSPN